MPRFLSLLPPRGPIAEASLMQLDSEPYFSTGLVLEDAPTSTSHDRGFGVIRRNVHKRPTCTPFGKEERREEGWCEWNLIEDRREGKEGEMGCERSREKKKMMRRQDVGRNRKWGWPTGTRVISSILTECGFDFKTLHGLGSQMPVRNQKQTSSKAAINESWFPGE